MHRLTVYLPALHWVPEIELVSWRSALFEVPIGWSLFLHMQIVYSYNSVVQPQETQGEIYPLYGGKGVESFTYKMLETFITKVLFPIVFTFHCGT